MLHRANLEFIMILDDRIAANLGKKLDLLQEALRSHRRAIALDQENTDALFNTAQVLTSLAEELIDSGGLESKNHAKELLKESTDIFAKCLASEYQGYEQIRSDISNAQASQDAAADIGRLALSESTGEEAMDTSSVSAHSPAEWATVVEPVTPGGLLKSCAAQLGALTSLLEVSDHYNLADIQSRLDDGLETVNKRIPLFINYMEATPSLKRPEEPTAGPTLSLAPSAAEEEDISPKSEALIAAANFRAGLLESRYRSGHMQTLQYATEIEQIFAPLLPDLSQNQRLDINRYYALAAYADVLFEFATAVSFMTRQQWPDSMSTPEENLEAQWAALSQAQSILTKLSLGEHTSRPSPARAADIFSARGNIDLLRLHVASLDNAKPLWVNSRRTLASNAGVYYRGARLFAERAGAVEDYQMTDAKAVVAEILKMVFSGEQSTGDERWKDKREEVISVLQGMVEDHLIGERERETVMSWL
jgi:hypothetical protein